MKKNSGFTLIELLVVIAIIGILSSVVLASLNTARSKGADANIKSNLSGVRAQAELQYDTTGCYSSSTSTACSASFPAVVTAAACPVAGAANIFGQTNIAQAIAGATTAAGGFNACAATVGGGAWVAVVQLKSDTAKAWCVDSTGKSKEVANGGTAYASAAALATAEITGAACTE